MAISIAHGTEFLGKRVRQGLVLYLAIEDPDGVVKTSFRRLGITDDTPLHVHYGAPPADAFTALRQVISDECPVAVFVDTIGRMRNGRLELNDYAATLKWLEPLLYSAHETGTAIVLLYHDTKAGRNTVGYDAMFSVLGSVGIAATIDQLIAVRRKGGNDQRSFFTVGRYGDLAE